MNQGAWMLVNNNLYSHTGNKPLHISPIRYIDEDTDSVRIRGYQSNQYTQSMGISITLGWLVIANPH